MLNRTFRQLFAVLALAFSSQVFAVLYDDFTQATDTNSWVPIGYACLTAGTATNNTMSASTTPPGIPGCNLTTPETSGGALRLTPSANSQHGAIVSTSPFPSNQGLQVTFTTYTYGGDSGGNGHLGADGISFFMIDPTKIPSSMTTASNLGSWGGSLAYTCSNVNTPYVGLTGAYLGLGMDEYGNFLNGGSTNDNTATGIAVTGGNSWGNGGNQQSNRIGLRGAGNVSWPYLNANYPYYYPSSLSSAAQNAAVQNTCKTGTLWDYSSATSQNITSATVPGGGGTTMTVTTSSSGGYVNGDSVTIGGTITAVGASQNISSASASGTTMTVTVPSVSGYSNGQSVIIGGTIVGNYASQSISTATVSGSTMTLTVPSVSGYSNGANVSISGLTANTSESISSASVSGTTMTLTVPNVSAYQVGESVVLSGLTANTSQSITGASVPVGGGSTMTVTVPSTAGYTAGGSVTLAGLTANTSELISSASVSGSTMTVTVPNGAAFATGEAVTIGGTITASATQSISSASVSGSTMTVNVPSTTGYTVGGSVTLAGLTANTSQSISSASVPAGGGTTMTVNVGNGAGFAVGESVNFTGLTATAYSKPAATVTGLTVNTVGGTPPNTTAFPMADGTHFFGLGLGTTSPETTASHCDKIGTGTGAGTAWLCRGSGGSNPANATSSSVTDSTGKVWYLVSSGANTCAGGVPDQTAMTASGGGSGYSTTEGACPATASTYTLTVTAANTFAAGDTVTLAGTMTPASLKTGYTISSATASSFIVPLASNPGAVALGAGPNTATDSTTSAAPSVTSGTVATKVGNALTFTLSSAAGSITNSSGTISAVTAPTVNGSQTIATVGSGTFTVTLAGAPANTITNSSGTAAYGTAPTVPGGYTIGSVSGNTFTVTLSAPAYSITNTSGTAAATTAPSVTGSKTIASVLSGTQFTVALNEPALTITNSSGTASISSNAASGTYAINSINTGSNTFTVLLGASATSITDTSGTVAASTPPSASGTFPISNVNTTTKTFQVTLSAPASSITNSSGTVSLAPVSLDGTYTINTGSINTGSNTFAVTLGSSPTSITNTSGTVSGSPTVTGTYTISNVTNGLTSSSFTVTLASAATSITNTSGTVIDNTNNSGGRNLGAAASPSFLDYGVIPNGYFVLPSTQPIANESASTRSGAVPITYKLQITPNNLLNFFYSYNGLAYTTVLSGFNIASGNGPVPANFLFGFAASTGGSRNYHDITCFIAEPMESSTSASANTVQAGQIRTSTQVYLASYNPSTVSGSLVSSALVNNNGTVSVSSAADWDGSCVLTGGTCQSTGVAVASAETPTYSAPTSYANNTNTRQLLTWNGTQGVGLEWASLTTGQQTILNSTDSNGQYRLSWLRGDRTEEQTAATPGPLRARSGVLGDIIDSSPIWIGPPATGIGAALQDNLYGTHVTPSETSYNAYANSLGTRMNVVYAGANDGLLHGFRAGSFASDGITYDATYNDGHEVIGFMPSTVLANSNVVSLTNPAYNHNYFVDAPPGSGDLFYGGSWHTWLVGGLGMGGSEIYALDVTDPTGVATGTTPFSEANASSLVKGDWTSSTITCQTVAGVAVSSCGNNLGNTYGTPLIRRMHNGQWALIFGNGLNSTNAHAGIFIGLINSTTAAVTFYWLDTGSGSSGTPNGIEYASSADLDGDHITDYLYAGDLLGHVWRFDVTSTNIADWQVSKFGQPAAAPLFTATTSSGTAQPITTKITLTATTSGGLQRVLMGFGTGQATPAASLTSNDTYSSVSPQTVYGIWDWDMNLWNNGTTTANGVVIPQSSIQYAALAEVTTSPYRTFTRSSLLVNNSTTVTETVNNANLSVRTMVVSTVCWQGLSSATGGCPTASNSSTSNNEYGWLYDLPTSGEQVIYNPVFSGGALFLNTTIPPVTTIGQCKPSLPGGWTMAFNMASGGGFTANAFPDPAGSGLTNLSSGSITGLNQGGVGTPFVVSVGTTQYVISPNVGGGGAASVNQINPPGGVIIKRMTWEELR